MRLSFTDRAIIGIFSGMYLGVISIGLALGGSALIDSVEQTIIPRTPEYLANQKKKELQRWIGYEKKEITKKEREIECFNKYKNSVYQDNIVRDIKTGIKYNNETVDMYEKKILELEEAFCLKEPAPLMPIEMGFRKLFYTEI